MNGLSILLVGMLCHCRDIAAATAASTHHQSFQSAILGESLTDTSNEGQQANFQQEMSLMT